MCRSSDTRRRIDFDGKSKSVCIRRHSEFLDKKRKEKSLYTLCSVNETLNSVVNYNIKNYNYNMLL